MMEVSMMYVRNSNKKKIVRTFFMGCKIITSRNLCESLRVKIWQDEIYARKK